MNKGQKMTIEQRQHLSLARQGMIFSDEHRANISKAKKGTHYKPFSEITKLRMRKPKSPEHIANIKANHARYWKGKTGELSVAWRGGLTSLSKRIRNSVAYVNWRKAIFERDDYTCQICGTRGGQLQADHIMPFSLFPLTRFDLFNGRTLCVTCHKETSTFGSKLSNLVQQCH